MKKLLGVWLLGVTPVIHAQWSREVQVPAGDVPSLWTDAQGIAVGTDITVHLSEEGDLFQPGGTIPGSPHFIDALFRCYGALYAGTGGAGVFRSTDDGLTWQTCSQGLTGLGSMVISGFAEYNGDLYCSTMGAGVFCLSAYAWVPFGGMGGSTNANVHFIKEVNGALWAGAGGNGYLWRLNLADMLFSPVLVAPITAAPFSVTDLLAVDGSLLAVGTYGIFRSADDGLTWSPAAGVLPGESGRLLYTSSGLFCLMGGNTSRLYHSMDDGDTWTLLGELPTAYAIAAHGARLYVGRLDGLWYRDDLLALPTEGTGIPTPLVFPNPTPGPLHVEPGTTAKVDLHLADMQGRVFYEARAVNAPIHLDLSALPDGAYLLAISNGTSRKVQRVVIRH